MLNFLMSIPYLIFAIVFWVCGAGMLTHSPQNEFLQFAASAAVFVLTIAFGWWYTAHDEFGYPEWNSDQLM